MANSKDIFYVIEVTNKLDEVGFIIARPEGIFVSTGGYAVDTTQFSTYEKAEKFKRKIKGHFKKIIIRRNDYIMENWLQKAEQDRDLFVIENAEGHRMFFDTRKDGYYFENREAGCCCWFSEDEAKQFLEGIDFVFPIEVSIKKIGLKGASEL